MHPRHEEALYLHYKQKKWFKDILNRTRGRLTAVAFTGKSKSSPAGKPLGLLWVVLCSCGKEVELTGEYFDAVESCGCGRRDAVRQYHNEKRGKPKPFNDFVTPPDLKREANIFRLMWRRCTSPSTEQEKSDWYDRGIRVCPRWKKFENFLEDMGRCPQGKSIDRIDNNRGYSPENCKWSTPRQQNRNSRRVKLTEDLAIEIKTLYAEGLNVPKIRKRLKLDYVSYTCVADCCTGRSWKELKPRLPKNKA